MDENISPKEEGERIAREYLSKRGWVREWRRSSESQVSKVLQNEEFETKERRCDQMDEDTESNFSTKVDLYRKDGSARSKEVLWAIVDVLGNRNDLGFFAKRIVDRLKRELGSI
jgi:hypothetical protein